MFYIQTNEFLMEDPGWKSRIMGILSLHEMRFYVKGNFESFILLETWGKQWAFFDSCFMYFVFINERHYFKSLEGYR